MAKLKVRCVKKSADKPKKAGAGMHAGPIVEFVARDNEDSTYTVFGEDAAGFRVDIASVATLAITGPSSPSVSVDPPQGMTALFHFTPPPTTAPVVFAVNVTWNDGSIGPFAFDQPVSVIAGPAATVSGEFGPPTPRP